MFVGTLCDLFLDGQLRCCSLICHMQRSQAPKTVEPGHHGRLAGGEIFESAKFCAKGKTTQRPANPRSCLPKILATNLEKQRSKFTVDSRSLSMLDAHGIDNLNRNKY